MCGRYATTRTPDALADEFGARIADASVGAEPDWNMAPTKPAPIVIERPPSEDAPGGREILIAQWGLVPSWAKDPKIGSRMINARSETVAEKPAFAKAFASRRAVVPADGYYEWYPGEKKQPFFICPKDRGVLAMAGLFEFWKASPDGGWLITFTVLTTSASDDLGHLHDRTPMMLTSDEVDAWLDPSPMTPAERLALLVPAVPGRLDAWPVSTEVNNHRNNGPQLIEPLPAE
ncbi:MAG TPA: SOS response-associated peptidase [Aeromicrobium sp.]|nr:SOS response-associated peptidase [Aeromicrobium sp.]